MSVDLARRPPGRSPTLLVPASSDDHLRIHAIELAVLQAPEDVLDPVGAPAEVGGVPAEEVLLPVGEELRIVGRAPAARDRVAFEVDVDRSLLALSRAAARARSASSGRCAAALPRRGLVAALAPCRQPRLRAQAEPPAPVSQEQWPAPARERPTRKPSSRSRPGHEAGWIVSASPFVLRAARPSPKPQASRPPGLQASRPPSLYFASTDDVCFRNLSAQGMKYFQFGPSVWPPSCCRQASCPSSMLTFTAGIFSVL